MVSFCGFELSVAKSGHSVAGEHGTRHTENFIDDFKTTNVPFFILTSKTLFGSLISGAVVAGEKDNTGAVWRAHIQNQSITHM